MELTFEIKDVTDIKVRKPTLSEFLHITDKLAAAYGDAKRTNDFMDDGESEIANLVTYPSKRDFNDLLADYPTLAFKMWGKIKESLGDGIELDVETQLTDEAELSAYGKRCIAISYLEKNEKRRFVFKKMGRPAIKMLLREHGDKGTITAESLCKIAKEAVVSGNKSEIETLFDEKPMLAMAFGQHVVSKSNTEFELFIKKA